MFKDAEETRGTLSRGERIALVGEVGRLVTGIANLAALDQKPSDKPQGK